jgi:hypothetical protein
VKGAGLATIDQVPHVLRLVVPLYTNGCRRATVGVPLRNELDGLPFSAASGTSHRITMVVIADR